MQIFVKTLDNRNAAIEADSKETVKSFKLKIQDRFQIHPDEQNLIFAGKPLKDDGRLEEYFIQNESTIFITTRLRGGN